MHMIGDTADAVTFGTRIPGYGSKVGVQVGADGVIQNRRTVLDAENHMDQNE
jgi:hypothetical protein